MGRDVSDAVVPRGARGPDPAVRRSGLRAYLRLMRIGQWVKNTFVLAPLVFGAELDDSHSVAVALATCCSFCLLSSAAYILNDCVDRERDRQHPEKRNRPIAAGEITTGEAAILSACLLILSLTLTWLVTNRTVILIEVVYLALNVAYSIYLRHVFLLDVFVIAAGFVLRVLAGAYAIRVPASHWIIICTFLLSLFLGFSKRRQEMLALGGTPQDHRRPLEDYSPELTWSMNLIVCSATIVCYTLYTLAPDTVGRFGTDRLVYSVPLVTYGLFRYLFLVQSRGEGGSPAESLFRDRPLLVCILLWVAYCAYVIYSAPKGSPS